MLAPILSLNRSSSEVPSGGRNLQSISLCVKRPEDRVFSVEISFSLDKFNGADRNWALHSRRMSLVGHLGMVKRFDGGVEKACGVGKS